jgi:hypothetical protein
VRLHGVLLRALCVFVFQTRITGPSRHLTLGAVVLAWCMIRDQAPVVCCPVQTPGFSSSPSTFCRMRRFPDYASALGGARRGEKLKEAFSRLVARRCVGSSRLVSLPAKTRGASHLRLGIVSPKPVSLTCMNGRFSQMTG